MDKDWTKFINASIIKHFDSLKQSKVLIIENTLPGPESGVQDWAELRINGPDYLENLKGQWTVNLSVDLMCNAKTRNADAYLIHKIVGIFQEACTNIQVYKFTGTTLDVLNPFFCLSRIQPIQTRQWGIISKDVDVYCTSIAASYQGEFLWP